MASPLFLAALAGGGYLLFQHLNRPRITHRSSGSTVYINGRTWLLRPGVGYTDVYILPGSYGATKETVVVRFETDTKRALIWAKNDAGNAAISDLGLIRS